MTPKLVEELIGDDGREAVISIIDENLSMDRYTYEVLFARNNKIIGKHIAHAEWYAQRLAEKWVKEGELTNETK